MTSIMGSLGVIGGADGPTAILVAGAMPIQGFLWLAVAAVVAYLLGSLDFGIIVSRMLYKDDIRNHGSGNAGTTNILRTFGPKAALITVLGDIGKGALATILGRFLLSHFVHVQFGVYGAYLAAFCAVCGHLWPIWFKFKGGKGVATAAGAILATAPVVVLALALVFFVTFFISRMVSLSSILAAVAYPVFTALWSIHKGYDVGFTTVCALIMALLVIWMHRSNIQRIKNGNEYKFDLSRKNKK